MEELVARMSSESVGPRGKSWDNVGETDVGGYKEGLQNSGTKIAKSSSFHDWAGKSYTVRTDVSEQI